MPTEKQTDATPQPLARFWGVRGSIPTPGQSTARYGGNTTCLELRIQNEIIIIDAGSGISQLGSALIDEFGANPLRLTLLNTHTHWDHIQGFPFFIPAYIKNNRIRVLGKDPKTSSLKSIFEKQMDGNHCFPVPLQAMQCEMSFEHLDPEGQSIFHLADARVTTCPTNHPGGCLGFRFDTPSRSLVFLSDHETDGQNEERIINFIKSANVLIADTQYTPEEATKRRGWGHGCSKGVVSLALNAGVGALYMTHHDPSHSDDFIDGMLADARHMVPKSNDLKIFAATEREKIPF
jgi:phosphoribosyl 1,2-cyclic phosphodiesterase